MSICSCKIRDSEATIMYEHYEYKYICIYLSLSTVYIVQSSYIGIGVQVHRLSQVTSVGLLQIYA